METEKKTYGIKEIREHLGLGLDEFSFAVGISVGHLNNIEKNTRPMTLKTAATIADALENMLASVVSEGNKLRNTDRIVKEIGAEKFNKNGPSEIHMKGIEKVEIMPELLLASCNASFYDTEVQEEVYELLVNIEVNKLYLKYIEEKGKNVPKEYSAEIERKMGTSIKNIFEYLFEDKFNFQGKCSVVDELRNKAYIYKHGFYRTPDPTFDEYVNGGDE